MDTNKKPAEVEVADDVSASKQIASNDAINSSEADLLSPELNSVESEAPTGSLNSEAPDTSVETSETVVEAEADTPVLDTIEAETPTGDINLPEANDEPEPIGAPNALDAPKEAITAESETPIVPVSETTPAASATAIGLSFGSANATKKRRKRTLIFASVFGVLAIVGGVVAWQMLGKTIEAVESATVTDTEKKVVKLGVTTSLVDGSAEYKTATGDWQKLRTAQLVSEGDSVRTGEDGRTVLSFDDGSALRLDASTAIRVDTLDPDNIQITQTAGTAYSRIVPSERTYAVTVDDTKYTAEGTAFATVSSDDEKGVQVYQSAVKVDDVNDAVVEGKQYYKQNKDTSLVSKVTIINMADLESDSFIKWNIAEDKKVAAFKEKLGILAGVKSVYKESTDKPVETKSDDNDNDDEAAVALKLSASAVTGGAALSWNSGDVAVPSGYKLLRSNTSRLPTLGSAEAMYISDSKTKSYNWASSKSGTYWYRVCVYQGNTGKCTNYSNVIQLNVTAKSTETKPTTVKQVTRGDMTLEKTGKYKVSWSYTGKAVYGYKLVYSKDEEPTYGEDSAIYISDMNQTSAEVPASSIPSGTYYVRVCAYTGSGCVDYSRQIVKIYKI